MFIFKKAKTKLGGKSCTLGGKQFVFRKARTPDQTLNDLDAYISGLGDEPVKWLAREVRSWGEFSYAEIESAIADGRLNELIDWQRRYAEVINNKLAPMWTTAMAAAALKSTKGKVILSDSDTDVKDWIRAHGGELISRLSDESRKAIAEIILRAQSTNSFSPREIAQQIRPLIGLTTQQANANFNYRQRIYQRYIDNGASQSVASRNADQAARRYASSQHRYRAETITHTELAFAYNRGSNIGVQRAIRQGLMGRCAMIWSTAGTNRVCSRCLALKDTVVGYTDESGVTLPPLHPRCRCTIIYDEIGTPQADKPLTSPPARGNLPRELAAGNIDTMTMEGSPPKLIDQLKEVNPTTVRKTLEYYEAQIVKAPIENGIIITATGEIYHCTGDLNTLKTIEDLDEKLRGAYVTHNHPVKSVNDYSFSSLDENLFIRYELPILRGIDEKFIYELNRNPTDNELAGHDLTEIYSLGLDFKDYHVAVMLWALINGVGYWRRSR